MYLVAAVSYDTDGMITGCHSRTVWWDDEITIFILKSVLCVVQQHTPFNIFACQ